MVDSQCHDRTMDLGPFAGPIYTIILLVDCIFFLILEWWIPRDTLHYVDHHWDQKVFQELVEEELDIRTRRTNIPEEYTPLSSH